MRMRPLPDSATSAARGRERPAGSHTARTAPTAMPRSRATRATAPLSRSIAAAPVSPNKRALAATVAAMDAPHSSASQVAPPKRARRAGSFGMRSPSTSSARGTQQGSRGERRIEPARQPEAQEGSHPAIGERSRGLFGTCAGAAADRDGGAGPAGDPRLGAETDDDPDLIRSQTRPCARCPGGDCGSAPGRAAGRTAGSRGSGGRTRAGTRRPYKAAPSIRHRPAAWPRDTRSRSRRLGGRPRRGHQPEQRPSGLRRRALVIAPGRRTSVAFGVLAPAAIIPLHRQQPFHRAPDGRIASLDARGVQRTEHGPRPVDVVGPPTAEPAAICFLLPPQPSDAAIDHRPVLGFAELGEEGHAARRDIRGRRVQQRPVVGERDVVEVKMSVVGVERAPAAIPALHPDHPGAGTLDRVRVGRIAIAVQQHPDHGGVVHIRVMIVVVLKSPAPRRRIRPRRRPVADRVGDLPLAKPGTCRIHARVGGTLRLGHGMTRETRVPDRRQAGLAESPLRFDDQQLANCGPGGRGGGVVGRIAQRVEHHHAVRHRRVDGAQSIRAVQPLVHKAHRQPDRALPRAAGEQRLGHPYPLIDPFEEPAPGGAVGAADPIAHLGRWCAKQLGNSDASRIAGQRAPVHQDQQRHHHGTRPVGNLCQMERKPSGQQHDLDRHHRHRAPGHRTEQRKLRPGEHVAALRSAERQNGVTRACHVRGGRIVADRLQCEIRLHARGQIGIAAMKQRPATVRTLDAAEIDADLGLQGRINSIEEMLKQHILGRDSCVRFQLEHPVSVEALAPGQGLARGGDGPAQPFIVHRCGRCDFERHSETRQM